MEHRETIDWSLIRKVLDRTATAAEREEFERWLDADARHRAYYERARNFRADRSPLPLELDRTFAELGTLLGIAPRRRTYRLYRAVATAAAAVVLLATVGLAWHRSRTEATIGRVCEELARQHAPATDKARLSLGDGRCYDLDEGESLSLDVEGGGHIENGNGNRLVYTADTKSQPVENRLTVPRGGYYSLQLEDGTTIHLNSESELVYPSVFAEGTRSVALTGEAYFDVAHDPSRPFIVEIDGYRIEVLGTQFNVTAYADERLCRSTLVEGSVRILPDSARTTSREQILLSPGQQLIRDTASGELAVARVDTERYTAWMQREFVFDNTPLEDALRTVSRRYDFRYEITDPELLEYTVTGAISMDGGLDYLFRVLYGVHMPIALRYENGILFVDKR